MKVTGPSAGAAGGGFSPEDLAGIRATEPAGAPEPPRDAAVRGAGAAAISGPSGQDPRFADRLTESSSPAGGPVAVRPPSRAAESTGAQAGAPVTQVGDVAAELDAGRLTPTAAVDQVVKRILDRQLGSDAPASLRAKVESALREALDGDALLAEKLRRLGGGVPR